MDTRKLNAEQVAGYLAARIRQLEAAIEAGRAAQAEYDQIIELTDRARAYADIRRAQGAGDAPTVGGTIATVPRAGRAKNTDVLVAHVRAHPGQDSASIADALMAAGFNRGQRTKKLVQTQLGSLASNGRLRKTEDGRYYVP